MRLEGLDARIDADLLLGRHRALVAELDGLVAANPFRERLRGQLMLALYRCGRQAEALAVRNLLDQQLGLEPGSELAALQRAVLAHNPSLDPAAAGRPQLFSSEQNATEWAAGEAGSDLDQFELPMRAREYAPVPAAASSMPPRLKLDRRARRGGLLIAAAGVLVLARSSGPP
ncbi:MAG: AfsR/SARP family transcriptional regulator [Solirubrobacteraceae bacterium]